MQSDVGLTQTGEGGKILVEEAEVQKGIGHRVDQIYQQSKLELQRLNLLHTRYIREADSLKQKLAKIPDFADIGIEQSNFFNQPENLEKLKEVMKTCQHEKSRRRAFRLRLLHIRLIPEVCSQIYRLSIDLS